MGSTGRGGRYGSQEMTPIMPESSLEATSSRAEAIRTAIRQLPLNYNGQKLNILNASIGIACSPEDRTTPVPVIKTAAQALYSPEANGRNFAIVATLS